ncbi:MAG: pyruvate dehydrogenase (acetyl-transferring), homodimeric type [Candidatus Brocadiae bacterium]|nr:pyruvate dehydrogenase (acetyl-transferring), homodimeric type [Candidatus Brocadiia bacterium]
MVDGAAPSATRHYALEDLKAPQKPPRAEEDFHSYRIDIEPAETAEWTESLDAVVEHHGVERAYFLLNTLLKRAQVNRVRLPALVQTPYINTISADVEPEYPGDEEIERRIRRIIRWNAVAMVVRANTRFAGIGGHLATYASIANIYEVGFNHFFRGKDGGQSGDQLFFQGHSAPGIYARAFLEGRLSTDQMERFRREVERGRGLSSYPHPWLMPEFWEFPTVSMGLGPMAAIYQARFNRYLVDRGIRKDDESRVWAFLGDGECDEPEALGALSIAAREGLDNLTFVVNCNLQRLDGPVRGNGKIIQELEGVFHGAGWNVMKVIWGRRWDPLIAADHEGVLVRRMGEACDGDYQRYSAEGGAFTRQHFFGTDPRLLKLVEHLSDDDIRRLRRGGHDQTKNYAAFKAATEHKGQPTVILAKTVKGWTLGGKIESKNVAHQQKKMEDEELRKFRDVLQLPIPDSKLEEAPFYHPGKDSPEVQYLLEHRKKLGGFVPRRVVRKKALAVPGMDKFEMFLKGTKEEVSTTGAFVRILADLCKDREIGRRVVPIIPDEARTFGMEALFRTLGIYSSVGQRYEPVDAKMLLSYREAKDGQVLEEGICEAGSMASFTAAATSYSTHGEPMIPFYIFYSMFGFQRIGDQAWALGDSRGRGFLMGATSGRTTLNGEGLQHQDGHAHLLASTFPTCRAYDPAFAYEIAVIIQDGLRRMVGEGEDCFYYISIQNENIHQPPMAAGMEKGILDGLYLFRKSAADKGPRVQLLGSGSILAAVLKAQEILAAKHGVSADVWSATSYLNLRREALEAERWNGLHPESKPRTPLVQQILAGAEGPVIAASDYMKAVPDQISRWVPELYTLGTDGYGRSDTREALRRHFEIDAESIVVAALWQLSKLGQVKPAVVTAAIREYGLDPEKPDPRTL